MLLLPVGLLGGSGDFLLDTIQAAVNGAWSVRRLRSGYAGFALRVRRANDGAELDIGFDGAGSLDTAAVSGFCGSGDGYVTRWYDQSGLQQDVTQAVSSYQPGIVSAGQLARLGNPTSRPGLTFIGAAYNFLANTQFTLGGTAYAACSVASRTANIAVDGRLISYTGGGNTVDYNSSQSVIFSLYDSGQIRGHQNGVWTSSAAVGTSPFQVSSVWTGSTHTLTLDGYVATPVAVSGTLAPSGTLSLGDDASAINSYDLWDGSMAEHIVIAGLLSASDQSKITNSQKSFFGTP